jgi:hypothetical protein
MTDEDYEKLKRAYSTGYKLEVHKCPRCNWVRGFFFFRDGSLGYDPGCFCNGNVKTRIGRRRDMEKAIERIPGLFSKWLYDAAQERLEFQRMAASRNRLREQNRIISDKLIQKKEKIKSQASLFSEIKGS